VNTKIAAVAVIPLFVAACTGSRARSTNDYRAETLCIDGLRVGGGDLMLGDLLRSRPSTRHWITGVESGAGPLVLVDGVEVAGTKWLTYIRARDVQIVETLDAGSAVPEFGARGRDGAIMVVTRASTRVPPARRLPPMRRCSDRIQPRIDGALTQQTLARDWVGARQSLRQSRSAHH
jgi:hypothetical protein